LLGDSAVGKSKLIERYLMDSYDFVRGRGEAALPWNGGEAPNQKAFSA